MKPLRRAFQNLQHAVRFTHYLGQTLVVNAVLERRKAVLEAKIPELPPPWVPLKYLARLFDEDSRNIEQGFYLAPEKSVPNTIEFAQKSVEAFLDLWRVKRRLAEKDTRTVPPGLNSGGFPDYYTQNFHYQTDGYMSEHSAELYDHQVETVFVGGADAMRRQCLVPLRSFFANPSELRPKIVDLACGTGRMTRELERNFPEAEILGIDLSPWYLKTAQRLCPSVNFLCANAEKLPLESESQDAVVCVFLYHELPPQARKQVTAEVHRVLKPGGVFVHLDSLQKGDVAELDPSLELFPKLYHEPFYSGYVREPVERLLEEVGLQVQSTDNFFYSKRVVARKSLVL